MNENGEKSRSKKVFDNILDAGADELENIGVSTTHAIIQEVKEWVIKKYSKFKSSSDDDAEVKLENLEMRIDISNKNVEIGMEKKEIAVMWAMRKMGYSEEETQQVLNLANKAYHPKD
jgi:Holliday junction resolvasome RuvABC DNA-binding subunit